MKGNGEVVIEAKKSNGTTLILPALMLLITCGYIFFVPEIDILPWFEQYNEKRVLECILLIFLSFLVILSSNIRQIWLKLFAMLPLLSRIGLGLLISLSILSSIQSTLPKFAFLEISLFTLLCIACFCFVISREQLGESFDKIVAIVLFYVSLAYLFGFLSYYFTTVIEGMPLLQRELFSNFSNIRFFNQFQTWTLPLIVLPIFYVENRSRILQYLAVIAAMGWWLLAFISGSRGSLLAMLIAFIAVLFFGKKVKQWLTWQCVVIIGGLLAYSIFFFILPAVLHNDIHSVLEQSIDRKMSHLSGRYILWVIAWELTSKHYWLGVGPMHYACVSNNHIAAHPHNAIFQIAAEWGIPCALIITILFLWGVITWIKAGRIYLKQKNISQEQANVYPALLASLVGAATHSMFSGIIVMPLSQVMLVLIIGWMLGIHLEHRIVSNPQPSFGRPLIILIVVIMISLTIMFWSITPSLFDIEELQIAYQTEHPGQLHPRFWQQGFIY